MKIKMKVALAGGAPPRSFAYHPGQIIEIDDKRGESWIEGGNAVAAQKHEEATAEHPRDEPPEPVDREADILDAVHMLLAENDKSKLIASGAPSVDALEELLDYDITSAERDTAYLQVR